MSTATWSKRVRRSLRGCAPKLSFGLIMFEEGFCLDMFGFLISLPFLDRYLREPDEMLEDWRVYYHERSVVINWGAKFHRYYHMPWDLNHLKVEVLRPDGTWAKEVNSWDKGEPDGRQVWTLPYRYVCKNGDIQDAVATVHVERREWRMRWLMWCPLFAKVRKSIDIMFDREMGEQSGSYKGGVVGTGYTMKRGETAEMTLRRMEAEHRF